mmetsp:Transcript_18545/g.35250  ORF Transcript_18545/g.35250 Transcript_18545/m.35250 type:complete len:246 (-) Transcript_18545:130-867(-)
MPTTTTTTTDLMIPVFLVFVLWLPTKLVTRDEIAACGTRGVGTATCSTTLEVTAVTTRTCLPTNACPTLTRLLPPPVFVPTRDTGATSISTTTATAEAVVCTLKVASCERRTPEATTLGTGGVSAVRRVSRFAEATKKRLPSNPTSAACDSSCRPTACPCTLECSSCPESGIITSRILAMSFATLTKVLLKPLSTRPKLTPRFASSTPEATNTPFTLGWNPTSLEDPCVAVIATASSLLTSPTSR